MKSIIDNPPRSIRKMIELTGNKDVYEIYCEIHDDLTEQGIELVFSDRHALGELAISNYEMETYRNDILINGSSMEVMGNRGDMISKKNPSVDALEKVRTKYYQLLASFKMTPTARKVEAPLGNNRRSSLDDEFDNF